MKHALGLKHAQGLKHALGLKPVRPRLHGAIGTASAVWHIHGGPTVVRTPNERVRGMSDVAERVKKIVVEHLGVDEDKVVESASFIDDLGADSLDTVELVMAFEDEFGVESPDDAAEKILTVKDAIAFIAANGK